MSPSLTSSPAGVLTVPLGVVEVCQAGTSLTQPQSNFTVPPRLGSWTVSPSSPSSLASSTIATTVGPGALGDGDRVADVVAVAVGQQDRGGVDVLGADSRLGIAGQERVDEDGGVAVGELEAGMAEKADVHWGVSSGSVGGVPAGPAGPRELAGELEADSDADEHAESRLLGQQSADRRQPLAGFADPGRLADGLVVPGVKPAAVGQSRGEHALERRRGTGDQVLRRPHPFGVGDGGDRRVELGVGVGAIEHSGAG